MALRARTLVGFVAATAALTLPGGAGAERFVPSVEARSATIWAVGDGADGRPAPIGFGQVIANRRPTRFLYLGDVYKTGTAAEFATNYHRAYGRMTSVTAPTPGNHEWPNRSVGYKPYWRMQKGVEYVPPYYAFRAAGWQILSLNSQAAHDAGSAQVGWLSRKLAGPGNCRIAFMHRPRWTAGRRTNVADLVPLWRTLRGHTRFLLSGHDHNSQRFRSANGLIQLVAGAGGHSFYDVDESHPRLVWSNDGNLVALRLRLTPGLARFAFVRRDGVVLERGRARCSRA